MCSDSCKHCQGTGDKYEGDLVVGECPFCFGEGFSHEDD